MQPPQTRATEAAGLMAAIARGDRAALARLIALYGAAVERYAAQVLHRPDDAPDVAQEVFLRVWHHGARYDPGRGAVSTWIWRIALRLCLDANRKTGLRRFLGLEAAPEPEDDTPLPEAALAARQRLGQTRAALSALPERQRQALLLRVVAEQSTAEIAQTLGIGPGAVEQLLVRARAGLRRQLDQGASHDARG